MIEFLMTLLGAFLCFFGGFGMGVEEKSDPMAWVFIVSGFLILLVA